MSEATVSCGCGRKMTLDVMRGRGAYRCGCGVRIKLEEPKYRADTCVAPMGEQRCRRSPTPSSSVPLCKPHLNEVKASVGLIKPEELDGYTDLLAAAQFGYTNRDPETFDKHEHLRQVAERHAVREAAEAAKRKPVLDIDNPDDMDRLGRILSPTSVVYFIRMGDLIKIGTTISIRKRVSQLSLTMSHVLATEPGSEVLESRLHEKFAHLREHGEWFRPEPDLLEYVEEVKRRARRRGPRAS